MKSIAIAIILLCTAVLAPAASIDAAARRDIDRGNQAWVNAMKSGDLTAVVKSFASDALDCGVSGACIRGRAAIEQALKTRIAKYGRANSASVTSLGAVQQGDFVYEWGHSDAFYGNGKKLGGRYLTVWQRQPDGSWQIFRNMAIPANRPH